MRLSVLLPFVLTFASAAAIALITANFSVKLVEETSEIGVRRALDAQGLGWAEVQANGLQVALAGTAPTEAERFRAQSTAGTVVDAARVIDEMEVEAVAALAAPHFSAEILRNDSGLSIIGLIPSETDRDAVVDRFTAMTGNGRVTDLLETASYSAPTGWDDAFAYALNAMEQLPRAKVSVAAGRVSITAITDSAEARDKLERSLRRSAPPGLQLSLDIAAPRPVITPFTLRFVLDENGGHFDACSADSEATRQRIVAVAEAAGLKNAARCVVGMGVPTPTWADAVERTIVALSALGQGSVTIADADITLVAHEDTPQAQFDRVIGELETALPEVFALHAKLPKKADPNAGPPEFTATRSPEGQVQLRGRLSDDALRELADSYARARFGSDMVYTAARVVEDLPDDWPARVLTGLEALSALSNGSVRVSPDLIEITGNTGNPDASAEIASLMAEKLGEAQEFEIDVTYQKKLDPVLGLPTPTECEAQLQEVVAANKINFEPGSATIDASALATMDAIAEILKRCGSIPLEIQGYTDSQGRAEMNLALSQSRAQSVLNELRARRVLTSSFVPKGYGEERPIQDNDTEAGREANRRIEFRLIRPDTVADQDETTLENLTQTGNTETNDAETETD